MIKAVIFDLDGTIIDSIPFHKESFLELFNFFGVKIQKKKIGRYMRLSTEEIYKKLNAKKLLNLEMEKFLELRRKHYYAKIRGKNIVFRDVFPAVKKLKKYRLGIATNSSRLTLEKSAPKKLIGKFDATISFTEVYRAKPDPEMLAKLAKKFRAKNSECIVIGDSIMDVRAAKKAGMISIAIARKTGASTLKELKKQKPAFIIKNLEEVPKIIEKLEACN